MCELLFLILVDSSLVNPADGMQGDGICRVMVWMQGAHQLCAGFKYVEVACELHR